MQSYTGFPENSRVWIYQCNRELSSDETKSIKQRTDQFIYDWASHGTALSAQIEIFYNVFLVVFVDEEIASASGCSIDKSFQLVKDLETEFDISLLDRMVIAYRKDQKINLCRIDEFEGLIKKGVITEDTIVFNNLVDRKVDFDSKWEVLIKDSWHNRLLQ
jgi:hypothetical protein